MRSGVSRIAVVCAVAAMTAACASGPERTTVEFLVFGEPEEVAAYRSLVEAFEESQSGIAVDLLVAGDRSDLLTRISTSVAAGDPPELFLVNYRFYGQFAAAGALEPLGGRLDTSSVIRSSDFHAVALDAFRWDGEQVCLPQNVSSLAVYYNATLFEEAGLAEPPDGWSFADLTDAARALTVDRDGDGRVDRYGLGVEPGIVRLAAFVWSAGGELFDDPVRPTRFVLDTVPALTGIQAFLELRSVLGVVPTEDEMESEDLESQFLNGRLAMFVSSRKVVPSFRTIEGFDWDVAPFPVLREPVNVLHADAYCLTAGSDEHDAAWSFVEYALSRPGQELMAATGRTVPSRIDVSESAAFLDPSLPPSRSSVFVDAIPTIRPLPSISTWPEIEDVADALVEEAMFDPVGAEALELAIFLQSETADAFERAEP